MMASRSGEARLRNLRLLVPRTPVVRQFPTCMLKSPPQRRMPEAHGRLGEPAVGYWDLASMWTALDGRQPRLRANVMPIISYEAHV